MEVVKNKCFKAFVRAIKWDEVLDKDVWQMEKWIIKKGHK